MSGRPRRIFRILVVCTGNQCRSPAAERILGRLLVTSNQSPFELDSAGTEGPEGLPIHPATAAALTRRGVPVVGHVSRILHPHQAARADLILVAERRHRAAVLHADPEARDLTFTIGEFARLLAAVAPLHPDGPRELVAAADTQRHLGGSADVVAEEVPDPIGGAGKDHEDAVRSLQASALVIATAMLASSAPLDTAVPRRGRLT